MTSHLNLLILAFLSVWPVKVAKCQTIKGSQNDFTRKIKDFDTFAKIA